jgi:hypothetical protein
MAQNQSNHSVDQVFVYAKLGRTRLWNSYLFGTGLGNTLFAWARAEIAAEKFALPVLAPVWQRLTSGGGWISALKTLGTRRTALRTYSGLLGGRQSFSGTCESLFTLATALHLDESLLAETLGSARPHRQLVFIFEGMRDGFVSLTADRAFISARFRDLVNPRVLTHVPEAESPRFACHVRMGDYNAWPGSPSETNARLPIHWYVDQLKAIAERWPTIPIDLFSDGTDMELHELLQLPGVRRSDYGNPIADLVMMSRARVLICSGSSFSGWAAFLGEMPSIWYPRRLFLLFGHQALPNAIERQRDGPLPTNFCEKVAI